MVGFVFVDVDYFFGDVGGGGGGVGVFGFLLEFVFGDVDQVGNVLGGFGFFHGFADAESELVLFHADA